MKTYKIAAIPADGIGPKVIADGLQPREGVVHLPVPEKYAGRRWVVPLRVRVGILAHMPPTHHHVTASYA